MKNKIAISTKILLLFIFIFTATQVFSYWGSSGDANNCPDLYNQGTSCTKFHNNGYSGGTGAPNTHFRYGLPFASFNGYKDQTTEDGRPFNERQFLYIESLATAESVYATIPYPSPWDNASNYNFSQGTSVNINFTNDEPKRVGFWGYMHNNGEANKYPAYDTTIKINDWGTWNNPVPQTQFKPRMYISSSNTKPRSVWADVTVTGSQPFTLVPKEFYIVREKDLWRNEVEYIPLNTPAQIQNVTTSGFTISSNPSYSTSGQVGRFDSSQVHYVKVYFEFEAVPQVEDLPKECADLKTDPGSAGLAVAELNVLTPIRIDTLIDTNGDPYREENGDYPTIRYCYNWEENIDYSPVQYETGDGCAEAPSNVQISFNATKAGMLTIQVIGADYRCSDFIKTEKTPEEEVDCAELVTDPGRTHQTELEVGETFPIDVERLIDTEGNDYLYENGNIPTLQYCYDGDIAYYGNFVPDVQGSGNCILASSATVIRVLPGEAGTMTIRTVGAENVCWDTFDVNQGEEEGECVNLTINQSNFSDSRSTYSATVETDPENLDYNIRWTVERNGSTVSPFPRTITDSNEINLDDYSYDFRPGDVLIARATNIYDPNDQCVDRLQSEEKECEYFVLDREEFVRDDQEVCFDTDWPVTELEYETSDGKRDTLEVNGDCFVLEREVIEDASWIDIWVPDYEDVCKDRLIYKIEPPDFDKNVRRARAGAAFSDRTVANFNDEYVDYEIKYTHYNDGVQDVTITDTIGVEGRILGYVGDQLSGGYIDYRSGSMVVTVGGRTISPCNETDNDLCYTGDIGTPQGVTVYNAPDNREVRIQYRGNIHSEVNVDNCTDKDHMFNVTGICGETYNNVSRFRDDFTSGSSTSEVMIPCPYIIIRSGGDVFLENPLDYGVDTLACADIANVDVPIITPDKPTTPGTPSTGPGTVISPTFTAAICKNQPSTGEGGETGYEDIAGISSLICEVKLKTSEALQQRAIVLNIEANKQKVARYEQNLNNNSQINNENELPASINGVYYKNDGDLTLGDGVTDLIFTKGAKTIIVENGDIKINSKIVYEDDASALLDTRNIASLTLIVINGSILINTNETAGVFFAQEGERADSGQICQETCADQGQYNDEQYIHYGSIYGDINNLLKYRTYAGDPAKEEGAVVIRFDSRIYLNPSVVLQEILPSSEFVLS
ncbi:hypothetical protein JW911_02230 [Candidatus Peregrinibacteria bacterium]|nr:hypothetical protein [Candidatus Peregrinibacteria bacterium]